MTPLVVEATYENGTLKPNQPLPLRENEKVEILIRTPAEIQAAAESVRRSYGLIRWTGSLDDLDHLIEHVENDPLEGP